MQEPARGHCIDDPLISTHFLYFYFIFEGYQFAWKCIYVFRRINRTTCIGFMQIYTLQSAKKVNIACSYRRVSCMRFVSTPLYCSDPISATDSIYIRGSQYIKKMLALQRIIISHRNTLHISKPNYQYWAACQIGLKTQQITARSL